MTKLCQYCGKEFLPKNRRGPSAKHCSRDCKEASLKEAQSGILTTEFCENCSTSLTQFQARRGQRFCSHSCYAVSTRTLKGTLRTCVVCGADYEPAYRDQKCCSNRCAKKSTGQTIATAVIEDTERECVICGAKFSPHIYHPEQKTCSKFCKRKLDTQQKNKSGYKRRVNKLRRDIASSTESEAIDRVSIFNRDGWKCQVCGKKVNPDLKYPHPMSASLDHILPLSLGGSHTRANVQLVHLRCNFVKNNTGGSQLRLLSEV